MQRVLAQNLTLPGSSESISGPVEFNLISDVINKVIPYVFAAAGFGLLLMLLSAGFTFLTSAGDAKKLESGRGRLTASLTGFIVIFVAYWLVQILGKIFGIEGITKTFQ